MNGPFLFGTPPINSIDQGVEINRALWTLAERMQRLKGGSGR
jgi:hypothetical protein